MNSFRTRAPKLGLGQAWLKHWQSGSVHSGVHRTTTQTAIQGTPKGV